MRRAKRPPRPSSRPPDRPREPRRAGAPPGPAGPAFSAEIFMNILIVHAHPEPQSFCTAMKDLAVATLGGAGHSVQVSDLYAMNWNPVASAADFPRRSNPD